MAKSTEIDWVDLLSKSGSKEYNEAIASRLESMRAYLSHDEWTKGLSIYIKALLANSLKAMMDPKTSHEGVQYSRGFASALTILLNLPRSVEGEIEKQSIIASRSETGEAGY